MLSSSSLAVALSYCRPKMARRIVHCLGELGIPRVFFFRPYLTEKSYEKSDVFSFPTLLEAYRLGREQTWKSQEPEFQCHGPMKAFFEDVLFPEFSGSDMLITEPQASQFSHQVMAGKTIQPKLVVFGPERGFTEAERRWFKNQQITELAFFDGHLRLETAVPLVLGQIISFS